VKRILQICSSFKNILQVIVVFHPVFYKPIRFGSCYVRTCEISIGEVCCNEDCFWYNSRKYLFFTLLENRKPVNTF